MWLWKAWICASDVWSSVCTCQLRGNQVDGLPCATSLISKGLSKIITYRTKLKLDREVGGGLFFWIVKLKSSIEVLSITYFIPLWWNHKFQNLKCWWWSWRYSLSLSFSVMMVMMMVMMMMLSLSSYPYGGTINFEAWYLWRWWRRWRWRWRWWRRWRWRWWWSWWWFCHSFHTPMVEP